MKKVFAILLVLTLVFSFVFADSSVNEGAHRLTISSLVEPIVPQFEVYGTFNSDYSTDTITSSTTNDTDDATLESLLDVSKTDITAYFIIKQNSAVDSEGNAAVYARYNAVLSFTLSVGAFIEQDPSEGREAAKVQGHLVSDSAVSGEAAGYTGYKDNVSKALKNAISTSFGNMEFTSTYTGRVNNGQEIGRFAAIWYKDTTIPNGIYEANVIVTISVT